MAVCTQSKLHTLCFNDSHYCYGTGQRRNEDLSISSIRMATLSRELVAYEEGELERPKWSGKPLFLIWSSALFLQTPYLSPQARCPTSFSSGPAHFHNSSTLLLRWWSWIIYFIRLICASRKKLFVSSIIHLKRFQYEARFSCSKAFIFLLFLFY